MKSLHGLDLKLLEIDVSFKGKKKYFPIHFLKRHCEVFFMLEELFFLNIEF